MAGKYKNLEDYMNSFSSVEEKIKAMVAIKSATITERIPQLEEGEYETLFTSLIFPTDNKEGEPLHVDRKESLKRLKLLYELQGKAHEKAEEEHKMWTLFGEDVYKKLHRPEEQTEVAVNFCHYMTSKANNEHSVIMSIFVNLYSSPLYEQLMSTSLSETSLQEEIVSWYGNEYTKKFMTGDTIKGQDPSVLPGFTDHKVKCVSQWVQYECAAGTDMPWLSKEEKRSYDLKVYGKVGVWTKDAAELRKKMGELHKVYEDMEAHMKSAMWDSSDYKNMIDSMKKVSDYYKEHVNSGKELTGKEKSDCTKLMNAAMKNAVTYIDSHISARVTPNGKRRFDAAMMITGICNMDSASKIKEIVDRERGEKSDQLVNFSELAKKYHTKLDTPFAYRWMRRSEEVLNNTRYQEYLKNRTKETLKDNLEKEIFSNMEEKQPKKRLFRVREHRKMQKEHSL